VKTDPNKSIILISQNSNYSHSTAVIKIALLMKGIHQILIFGYLLPRPLRDYVYNLIANRRSRLLNEECDINSYQNRPRFLQ